MLKKSKYGAALAALFLATPAFAADTPALNSGDTAWMLTSAALVLMMTIPGLGLFYGGMVRARGVLRWRRWKVSCAPW